MYITDIVTYGIEIAELESKYSLQLEGIKHSLEKLDSESIGKSRPKRGPGADNDDVTTWKMKYLWEEIIQEYGWHESKSHVHGVVGRRFYMRMLGYLSDKVSCTFSTHRDHLNRWLYTSTPIACKNGMVDIPIMILPTREVYESYFEGRGMGMREEFERIIGELEELSPLSHSHPFVLIGISTQKSIINYHTIDSEKGIDSEKVILDRSIEFPPEFRQAGLGILNYFGEIVREKYPDENAKIRIEQDGSNVRMVIEAEDGSREIIEKALEEYELVVTGQIPPESIFDDRAKILELKNELRIAESRIESQRDLIEYQREDMRELKQLFSSSITSSGASPINLTVAPNINVSTSQANAISFVCNIGDTLDDVQYLMDVDGADQDMKLRLNDLYESIENIDESSGSDTVKSSSGIKKLHKFLNESSESGTKVNEFLAKVSDGVDIAKSLAKKYNSIAEWCGAPQVPKVFSE